MSINTCPPAAPRSFPGDGYCGLSPFALSYAAGLLEHSLSGSLLAWACPSTNSYRRLAAGSGAPSVASLASSSRAAAIRVPGYLRRGQERIEFRVGDATSNAHYFLSAMLLAGIDGAKRALDPVAMGFATDPDPDVRGHDAMQLPSDLILALGGLERTRPISRPSFRPRSSSHGRPRKGRTPPTSGPRRFRRNMSSTSESAGGRWRPHREWIPSAVTVTSRDGRGAVRPHRARGHGPSRRHGPRDAAAALRPGRFRSGEGDRPRRRRRLGRRISGG